MTQLIYDDLLSEADVTAQYPKEWVAIEIVSLDKNLQWKGRLVGHSPHREVLVEARKQFGQAHPEAGHVATFYTGPTQLDDIQPCF